MGGDWQYYQLQKKIDMFYGALRWDKPTDSEKTIERFF